MSLSKRGQISADQNDIPWRFAIGQDYDAKTNPSGIISFASAQNTLITKDLETFAQDIHIPAQAFTYGYSTAGGPHLPTLLANFLNSSFNVPPSQSLTGENIQITAGATSVHELLAFSLGDPGQGILTSRPVYGRFELDFGNRAGLEVVYANTESETCFLPPVVDAFRRKFEESEREGARIAAVLIVNPNNPLGRCYPRETLVELMRFCQEKRVHLVSDEVYGCSVWGDTGSVDGRETGKVPFTSVLSIERGIIDDELLHVIYGFSKDFGASGLRLGALVTRSRELRKAVKSNVRFHGPSGPSVAIASAMLENGEWMRKFLARSRERTKENYGACTKELERIGVRYLEANAGFFVYVDLAPYLPPEEKVEDGGKKREIMLVQKLVDAGVFLHPGEEHALKPGWFRLVYTQGQGSLKEGIRRIESVINNLTWG